MKKIKINRVTIIIGLSMLAMGLLIGWWAKPSTSSDTNTSLDQHDHVPGAESQVWTCSMHPQIRQSEPGQCPICGMDLIPLESETSDVDPLELRMSPTAMQLANVQTTVVGAGQATREVRMNGKVQADERLIFSQVTHLQGRVEQLAINYTGEPVRKGQQLAMIYSPELVTAQEELFSAQKIRDLQPALFTAAKEKLKNWKLSDAQIEAILAAGKPQERFPILADVSGIVLEKRVNLGDYLMRGMPLYDIVDLSQVWVLFDIYESDMPWVKVGSEVTFSIQSLPGEEFTRRITFIDPVINPLTRVATARVEMSNPGGQLKPEMFAGGLVKTRLSAKKESLMVPKTAVMWTGKRSVVYVKRQHEQGVGFLMQEVELGPLVGDDYVINAGLDPGTEVVTNGAFSIDAAAQLAGKPSMMSDMETASEAGKDQRLPDYTDVTPMAFKQQLAKVTEAYLPLKDAFVNSTAAQAAQGAQAVINALSGVNMGLIKGEAHLYWMTQLNTLQNHGKNIAAGTNVEQQRRDFDQLSQALIRTLEVFGIPGDTLYVQHCPMAFDNAGADWISKDPQIRNPYFGEKMMSCGLTQETITKDFKNPPVAQPSKAPPTVHQH